MLGGPPTRSGFTPPSGRVTPPRCGLFLLRRSHEPALRRYSAVTRSTGAPQETNLAPPGPPLTHWRPGRSSGQSSAGDLALIVEGTRRRRRASKTVRFRPIRRLITSAGTNAQRGRPESGHLSGTRPTCPSPGSPAVPRARLRGGASHEAQGRRGARGGGAISGWGRPPRGVACACCARYSTSWSPALEQFLFVDDVVAVEDGAGLVAGQEHGDATRGRWRGSSCGRRCGGNRGGSGSVRQPPDRQCATPVRQRRTGMPSRWKTSGLSGSRRARRRARASAMGCDMGESAPPRSSSARARAG